MEKNNIKSNPLFTRENVNKIVVLPVVNEDICSFIGDKLRQAGIYFRITSRVKSHDSIYEKITSKNYGQKGSEYENKKLQDLIGIRIILYFFDDAEIVKELLDSLFSEPGIWEATETTDSEFKARKQNGTFKIPRYLNTLITNPELSDYVDDTFEIQLRTNAFEGWHEIEHDLKYKGTAFNEESGTLSRQLNSILATLELCDYSLVKVTDDLAKENLNNACWDEMFKSHFRIRFTSESLHADIVKTFNADMELPRKFYNISREKLIKELWNSSINIKGEIPVNSVVKLLNDKFVKNEKLVEVIEKIESRKRAPVYTKKHFEPFKGLVNYPVFASNVEINTENLSADDAFKKACSYIYSWLKSRFKNVFDDIPNELSDYKSWQPGYMVDVHYDEDKGYMYQTSTHMDTLIPQRVWVSRTSIFKQNGKVFLNVINSFAELESVMLKSAHQGLFSRPNYYGEIADNIGIKDVIRLRESVQSIGDEEYERLKELIDSEKRTMPVVVFIVNDREWADKFDIDYFAYLVGYYAHVMKIDSSKVSEDFARTYGLDSKKYVDSISVFYPGEKPQVGYRKGIQGASYEVIKMDTKKYWNEKGCKAYRRDLIKNIRERMIEGRASKPIVTKYMSAAAVRTEEISQVERWDACDEFGNVVYENGLLRKDADNIPEGIFHRVVCVYTITMDGEILITKRAAATRNANIWEITRGSVVAGEEVRDGAVRELKEETGLTCNASDLVPVYKCADRERNSVYFAYLNIIPSKTVDIILQEGETQDYRFVSADEVEELIENGDFLASEGERFNKFKTNILKKFKKII